MVVGFESPAFTCSQRARKLATVSRSSTWTPRTTRLVTSLSALLAAPLVGNPPRRIVLRLPAVGGTSTAKYQVPCLPSATSRGQVCPSCLPALSRQEQRRYTRPRRLTLKRSPPRVARSSPESRSSETRCRSCPVLLVLGAGCLGRRDESLCACTDDRATGLIDGDG